MVLPLWEGVMISSRSHMNPYLYPALPINDLMRNSKTNDRMSHCAASRRNNIIQTHALRLESDGTVRAVLNRDAVQHPVSFTLTISL